MELILNELSFDGQFQTQDEFVDYVLDTLIPVYTLSLHDALPI